mgnify:CR=1 FL=1
MIGPKLKSFRTALLSKGLTARSATQYTWYVRRLLRDHLEDDRQQLTVAVNAASRQSDGNFATAWNHFVAFAQDQGVTLPRATLAGDIIHDLLMELQDAYPARGEDVEVIWHGYNEHRMSVEGANVYRQFINSDGDPSVIHYSNRSVSDNAGPIDAATFEPFPSD